MNIDEYVAIIERIVRENDIELTENSYNIARFRARTQLPMDKCPCSPNDPESYCISPKCMNDIINLGECHCRCYRKKGL